MQHEGQQSPDQITDHWSFFEAYADSGTRLTLASPDSASFSHIDEESRFKDAETLAQKKSVRSDRRAPGVEIKDPGAFVFENFLSSETIRQGWIGDEASRTTEYDDWISGVDLVAEWPSDDGRPVRLAIDFTVTIDDGKLQKKIEKAGINVKIKYLRSKVEKDEQGKPKETICSMPLVVIGVDREILKEIADDQTPLSDQHPLRLILIRQAKAQIDWHLSWQILKLAEKHKKTDRLEMPKFLEKLRSQLPLKSAEEYQRLFLEFPETVRTRRMSKTDIQRIEELIRVKQKLDETYEKIKDIQISLKLAALLAKSTTNNRLSNF